MKPLRHIHEEIASVENLFRAAAATLAQGRRFRGEGARFKFDLEREVLRLHRALASGRYRHGRYRLFTVRDPKMRVIAAAPVRDRVVHHAVHDAIEPRLDRMFIHDSYACRHGKGTHRALDRAHGFLRANRYGLHLDVTVRILIGFFAELRLCGLVVFCRILIGKSGRIAALWSYGYDGYGAVWRSYLVKTRFDFLFHPVVI